MLGPSVLVLMYFSGVFFFFWWGFGVFFIISGGASPEVAVAMSLCQRAVKHSESDADGRRFSAGGGVKVRLHWSGEEERERCRTYAQGTLSAEDVCIDLARRIGERRGNAAFLFSPHPRA